ncbi:ral GTPase-activating protein subunit beta-like [Zophobas morio]|uniref:ral GTPase-activating protein subunit beta-like n=1 Tax=Zophobas morio TaxID=2755281 RepID=UPI003083A4BE
MLIIMMSITDLFFSQANSLADTVYDKMRKETLKFMSKYLNNLVLRALFEMWVASCSHCFPDPTLWKTLFFHAQFWRHESAFVPQWSFLSISLTHRLLSILYGKATGAPNLVLDGPTDSSLIELQVKALEPFIIEDFNIQCFVHCWFRMLMLIGNPCELELSICFLQAMQAVSSIILSFIDVSEPPEEEQATLKDFIYQSLARYLTGKYYPPFMPSDDSFIIKEKKLQKRNNYLKPPCGNSILNLFGEWLVEAAYSPFHQGRAQAIGILCRIFSSSKQDARPFLLTYLARFYIAVTDALESGDGMVTTLVIMNSERLFLNKLQGMKLLVVPFLVALEKTLTSKEPSYQVPYFVTLEKLRRTAIQILLSLFLYPNYYKELYALRCSSSNLNSLQINDLKRGEDSSTSSSDSVHVKVTKNAPHVEQKSVECEDALFNFSDLRASGPFLFKKQAYTTLSLKKTFSNHWPRKHSVHSTRSLLPVDASFKQPSEFSVEPSPSTVITVLYNTIELTSKGPLKSTINLSKTKSTSFQENHQFNKKELYLGKNMLYYTLLRAFISEKYADNLKTLLCIFHVYLENVHTSAPTMAQNIAKIVYRRLSVENNAWATSVALTAFDVLAGFAALQEYLVVKDLVYFLCSYIDGCIRLPPQRQTQDLHLKIAGAFRCLLAWSGTSPVLSNEGVLQQVLQAIELGLTGKCSGVMRGDNNFKNLSLREFAVEKPTPPSKRVENTAEQLLLFLLGNTQNNFSSRTLLTASQGINPKENVRHFAVDKNFIISFAESELENSCKRSSIIIIRDQNGLFSFEYRLKLLEEEKSGSQRSQRELRLTNVLDQSKSVPSYDEGDLPLAELPHYGECYLPSLMSTVPEAELDFFSQLHDICYWQFEQESQTDGSSDSASAIPVGEYPPYSPVRMGSLRGRQFMSHLNFISFENGPANSRQPRVVELLSSEDFYSSLQELDSLPECETETFTIFYARKGMCLPHQLLEHWEPVWNSSEFMSFLQTLGRARGCATLRYFKYFTSHTSSPEVFFYRDNFGETVFHVPACIEDLYPSDGEFGDLKLDIECTSEIKKETNIRSVPYDNYPESSNTSRKPFHQDRVTLIEKANITVKSCALIIWLENLQDIPVFPFKDSTKLLIYIYPLKRNLYRIIISGPPLHGPLLDGMIVNNEVLGRMTRATLLNFSRHLRINMDVMTRPSHVRKRFIEGIASRYHRKEGQDDVPIELLYK